MRTLLLDAFALLVYPGLLAAAAAGMLGEVLHGLVAESGAAGRRGWFWPLLRRPPVTAVAAAALGALAAVQLAAPLNLLDPGQRNLLTAAFAIAATAWLAWAWNPGEDGRLLFISLATWLLAVLTPAVLAQDLRPTVLATLSIGAVLPAKVAAALLYLGSLPAVVGVAGPGLARAQRLWLWLPGAGLFASLFLPPPGDDALGLAQFFGASAAAAVWAILLGRVVAGKRREVVYQQVLVAAGAATLALAVAAAAIR